MQNTSDSSDQWELWIKRHENQALSEVVCQLFFTSTFYEKLKSNCQCSWVDVFFLPFALWVKQNNILFWSPNWNLAGFILIYWEPADHRQGCRGKWSPLNLFSFFITSIKWISLFMLKCQLCQVLFTINLSDVATSCNCYKVSGKNSKHNWPKMLR